MVRVMASGVFDILHMGHVYYLQEAKKLGDELFVVVARDSTVRKQKHEPITPEEMRRQLVESLKPVDKAVLGGEGDMFKIVEEIKPDIIAIGYDQPHDMEAIKAELSKRGLKIELVKISHFGGDLDGTRKIVRKVIDMWAFTQKMKSIEGDMKGRKR